MRNAEIADAISRSWPTCTSSTGPSCTASWPTATPREAIREPRALGGRARPRRPGRRSSPAIGKTIAEKIDTRCSSTARCPRRRSSRRSTRPAWSRSRASPGFGPKRARKVFDELGVASIDELRAAAEAQQLRGVPGFGAKAEENVLAALAGQRRRASPRERVLLSRARETRRRSGSWPPARAPGVRARRARRQRPAHGRDLQGPRRRRRLARPRRALVEAFAALSLIEVSSTGEAGARAVTHNGLPVDLRVVAPENFGNLLQHFTGSGAHNEALRTAGRAPRPARQRVRGDRRRARA